MGRLKLILLLCLLLIPASLSAGEILVYKGEQTLSNDTIWSGEVLIDGILTVAAGVVLEIRPGTTVRFTRNDSNNDDIGEHEIFSQGTIRALGTAEKPVLFTSAELPPRPGDWGAVNMMVSEQENILQHSVVEYGYRGFHAHFSQARLQDSTFRNNVRGAQFQESQVVIERCRFAGNGNGVQFRDSKVTFSNSEISDNQWGLRCVYSDLKLTGNLVKNNLINGVNIRDGKIEASGNRVVGNRRGLYLQRSEGLITGNDLSANSEHGIFLEESNADVVENRLSENGRAGVRWLNSQGKLAQNMIEKNGVYALINDGKTAVNAQKNWWGTSQSAGISACVRDGRDREGMGLVDSRFALKKPLSKIYPEIQ